MNKEEIKERNRNRKEYFKAYRKAHRQHLLEYGKDYYEANRQSEKAKYKAKLKAWYEAHKRANEYMRSDVNSLGQTKQSIRMKSQRYLKKYGTKIPDYQIHHCFTYDDPAKFIYCSKELHLKIHKFLRDNNIDADSNHYEQIKHLLDDTVVVFGV